MPQEPERPIEKLLRLIAKSRREDPSASFELHPATRRMLQAELARKFPAQAVKRQTWARFLLHAWPKLTCGVAVSIALVLGVWLLLPQLAHKQPETLLAKNRTQTPVASTPQGVPSSIPPGLKAEQTEPQEQPLASAKELSVTVSSAPTIADKEIAAAVPPQSPGDAAAAMRNGSPAARDEQHLALATEMVDSRESKTALSNQRASLTEEVKAAEPAASQPTTTAFAAAALGAGAAGQVYDPNSTSALTVLTQHFDLLPSVPRQRSIAASELRTTTKVGRSDALGAAPPVLASFQLEQTGPQLRVIDRDGSIYVGNLQPGLAGGLPVSSQFSVPHAAPVAAGLVPAAAPSIGQTYLFRVAGTNRSLNQRVVFWGKLVDSTNATATDQHFVSAQLQEARQLKLPATPLPRSPAVNRRLSGTAVVGDGAEIAVEAVSASPQK